MCCLACGLLAIQNPPKEPPPFDADLFHKDEQVFSGHVEFLYWTLEEGSLDYALKMNGPAWGDASSDRNYAQGNFQTAGYGFDPGVRLALSFYRASRFWELRWQYVRETFRGSDHATAPGTAGEFLTGTWPQVISGPLQEATSHLHFNYNTFDMLVARVFNPNPHLRIRMLGGATTAWMSQQWIIRYINSANANTRIDNRWTYAAGGLKFGSTIDWFWTGDLYVTAAGSAAVLMGSYHNQSKQTATMAPSGGSGTYNPNIPLRNAQLENIRGTFTAQASLGPSWQKNFKHARTEVFAGYEITLWTNLQELYRSSAASPSEAKETWLSTNALTMQGISIRLSGDF